MRISIELTWLPNLLAATSDETSALANVWLAGITRIGAVALGLAVGVLVIWFFSRRKVSPQCPPHSPQQLFHELCRAHRLSAAQARLMEWVASDRQLRQPVMVFLDPLLLESSMARCDTPSVRKRLADLRTRLFAGLLSSSELER